MLIPGFGAGGGMGLADQLNQQNSQFSAQRLQQKNMEQQRKERGLERFMQAIGGVGQALQNRKMFNYQKERDAAGDAFRNKEFDEDTRRFGVNQGNWQNAFDREGSQWDQTFEYQKGRDTKGDERYDREFIYREGRDAKEDERYGNAQSRQAAIDAWQQKMDEADLGLRTRGMNNQESLGFAQLVDNPEVRTAIAMSKLGNVQAMPQRSQIPGVLGMQIEGVTPTPGGETSSQGDALSQMIEKAEAEKAAKKGSIFDSLLKGGEDIYDQTIGGINARTKDEAGNLPPLDPAAFPSIQSYMDEKLDPRYLENIGLSPEDYPALQEALGALADRQGGLIQMQNLQDQMNLFEPQGMEAAMSINKPGENKFLNSFYPVALAKLTRAMLAGGDSPDREWLNPDDLTKYNELAAQFRANQQATEKATETYKKHKNRKK